MEKIAFFTGETVYYWSSIVLTLAALTAVCFFLSLYLGKGGNAVAAFGVVPLALALSLVLARLVHWYCRADSYDGFSEAIVPFSPGGYALLGVFAGCILAAALTRLLHFHDNLPRMLDCMAVAGCAGIAVGRLASFFNSSDRGQIVQSAKSLPWVYPVTNAVSGATEYRLATFLFQSAAAGLLFLVLALLFFRENPRHRRKSGSLTALFLMVYCASQVILDSTRYDSLYLHSNGFVSMIQVLSAITLALTIVVCSVRAVKARGIKKWMYLPWVLVPCLFGGAGYMEYFVQRHGKLAATGYSIMGACLAGIVLLGVLLWRAGMAPNLQKEHK